MEKRARDREQRQVSQGARIQVSPLEVAELGSAVGLWSRARESSLPRGWEFFDQQLSEASDGRLGIIPESLRSITDMPGTWEFARTIRWRAQRVGGLSDHWLFDINHTCTRVWFEPSRLADELDSEEELSPLSGVLLIQQITEMSYARRLARNAALLSVLVQSARTIEERIFRMAMQNGRRRVTG